MSVTKEILTQYSDLIEEVKDLARRIAVLEKQIEKIKSEGDVTDSVNGGEGGLQHFKIKGFPYPEYDKKVDRLWLYRDKLKHSEREANRMVAEVESYIASIEDCRIRRIIRFRYIDKMTWTEVAIAIGNKVTEDSVRMEHNRFLGI